VKGRFGGERGSLNDTSHLSAGGLAEDVTRRFEPPGSVLILMCLRAVRRSRPVLRQRLVKLAVPEQLAGGGMVSPTAPSSCSKTRFG
jgi:hypothetical protein